MDFGPALNFGERGNIGEQTEKNEGEDSAKGMGFSVFGSRMVADLLDKYSRYSVLVIQF